MRKATRVVAALFGVFAGFGGPEHGYFEILQGNVRPSSLMFPAMGPPCDPARVWNACEPAVTVVPSLLVAGILATIVGLITMIWAAGFVHKKNGGVVLMLLCVALLLVGGGVVPPVIGLIAGAVATRIHAPLNGRPGGVTRFLAGLWPWPLVAFFICAFGQFVVGYTFNEFLRQNGFLILILLPGLLVLSVFCGTARDLQDASPQA